MYEELVNDLREDVEWAIANAWEVPIMLPVHLTQAADAIEELQADNAALNRTVSNIIQQIAELSKPHWIPVTERLPGAALGDVSEQVLVTDGEYVAIAEWFNFDECRPFWGYTGFGKDVTHWMPLPQPPTEQTVTDSNQVFGDSEQLDEPVSNPYKLEETR